MLPLAILIHAGTSPGQTFGVSVFNPFLQSSLRLTQSELSGCYLLASLLAALPMPFIGWVIDRHGLRLTGMVVIVLLGGACCFMAFVDGMLLLTIGFLMLRSFGQGALSLVSGNTMAMWFSRRLGFVTGLVGAGTAAAVAILPNLYLRLIRNNGWRDAYVILAVLLWVGLLPLVCLLYRNHPEDVGQNPDGRDPRNDVPTSQDKSELHIDGLSLRQAWRTRSYWIALSLNLFWGMIGTGITFHLLTIFSEHGFGKDQATATFTTLAISMAVMQLIGGALADRLPLNVLLTIAAAVMGLGVFVLTNLHSIWLGHLYALLFGSSQGLLVSVTNTLWPRYFGRLNLGQIRSSVWTGVVASCALGPFLLGLSFDYLGGYEPCLLFFALLLVSASLAAVFATPPGALPSVDQR